MHLAVLARFMLIVHGAERVQMEILSIGPNLHLNRVLNLPGWILQQGTCCSWLHAFTCLLSRSCVQPTVHIEVATICKCVDRHTAAVHLSEHHVFLIEANCIISSMQL